MDIALLCSSQTSIFSHPSGFRQVTDLNRAFFQDPLSDHLTLANAFDAYMLARELHEQENGYNFDVGDWCFDRGLDMSFLKIVHQNPLDIKIPKTRAPATDTGRIRKALAIAFCTQTAIRRKDDEHCTVHDNAFALLSPHSSSGSCTIIFTKGEENNICK